MLGFKRGLQSTAGLSARTRYTKPKPKPDLSKTVKRIPLELQHDADLKVTAPIPPASKNFVCPEDHPLWQFFADKKFMRAPTDLDNRSRPWTIPELRRKSFDDLHSLWYTSLKERNILARENHLLKNIVSGNQDSFDVIADKVRTTMWRIRHVLSERDWAFRIAENEFKTEKEAFIKEFETEFLNLRKEEDEEAFEMLARFQSSIFGISEFLDENVVDRTFVDGLKCIANLKLQKFSARNDNIKSFLANTPESIISDVGESFIIFTSNNTDNDIEEACEAVEELRKSGGKVSRYDELETVLQYVKQLSEAQLNEN